MEGYLIYSIIFSVVASVFYLNIVYFRNRRRKDLKRLPDAAIGHPMAQHPQIDEALCMGCGSCAAACPEGDVLGIVYGKAKMLNPCAALAMANAQLLARLAPFK